MNETFSKNFMFHTKYMCQKLNKPAYPLFLNAKQAKKPALKQAFFGRRQKKLKEKKIKLQKNSSKKAEKTQGNA